MKKLLLLLFIGLASGAAGASEYRSTFTFYTDRGNELTIGPAVSSMLAEYAGEELTYATRDRSKAFPYLSRSVAFNLYGADVEFYFVATTIRIAFSGERRNLLTVKADPYGYKADARNHVHLKKWQSAAEVLGVSPEEVSNERVDADLKMRGALVDYEFLEKNETVKMWLPVLNESTVEEFVRFNSYWNAKCADFAETRDRCDETVSWVEVVLEKL